ncbi:hypothetical protein Hanom_Chr10g00902371 [Helianthus anomalus]
MDRPVVRAFDRRFSISLGLSLVCHTAAPPPDCGGGDRYTDRRKEGGRGGCCVRRRRRGRRKTQRSPLTAAPSQVAGNPAGQE